MREHLHAALARLESRPAPHEHRALRLWLRLLTTTSLMEKQVRARLRARFDTTLPRFDVMAALGRAPQGRTMGELSRWLLVSKGNVTGVVRRLEEEGLVARTRASGDRRTHLVRLTPTGRRTFERWSKAHEAWVEEMLGALSEAQMQTLHRLLDKTKRHMAESEEEH